MSARADECIYAGRARGASLINIRGSTPAAHRSRLAERRARSFAETVTVPHWCARTQSVATVLNSFFPHTHHTCCARQSDDGSRQSAACGSLLQLVRACVCVCMLRSLHLIHGCTKYATLRSLDASVYFVWARVKRTSDSRACRTDRHNKSYVLMC